MPMRKHCSILFFVVMPTALAVWTYLSIFGMPFHVVFLKNCTGPLLLWQVSSLLTLSSVILFIAVFIFLFFVAIYLQRRKKSLTPFLGLWPLILTSLIFLPWTGNFPEFIPLALIILPVSSAAAFFVLAFHLWIPYRGHYERVKIFVSRFSRYIVWIITFFVLFTSGFYICEKMGYTGGDEEHYFTIARSMYEDHDVDLTNNIFQYRKRQSPYFHISRNSQGEHAYSWHSVGLSLILTPVHAHYKRLLVVLCMLGAFLALQIYSAVLEETQCIWISLWVWIVLSFSSPLWFYSFRALPLAAGGLCLLYVWRKMFRFFEISPGHLVILNTLMAWLLWLHDSFILAYGILGLILFYQWTKKFLSPRALVSVGFQALNLGMFFWFHYRWFGKALFGQESRLFSFWPGMIAVWFDYLHGMIWLGPVHLLGFILLFIYAFKKKNLPGFILLALYLSSYALGVAGSYWTGGTCHPGRRLVGIIPLACVPLGNFFRKGKNPAFYWLAVSLSLISILTMLYLVMRPWTLTRPILGIALSRQWLHTLSFSLPAFGRSFQNFPWKHVRAVAISFVLFILFWIFLLAKDQKKGHPKSLFVGMYVTLFWIFASVGWLKTHFDIPYPVTWDTAQNCVGKINRGSVGSVLFGRGVYRYLVSGLDKIQDKLSWSVEINRTIPSYVDLAKGRYRFHIAGTGNPFSVNKVIICELLEGKVLDNVKMSADGAGKFSENVEVYLSRINNRIRVEFSLPDEMNFEKMMITPIPAGLEILIQKIEEKRKNSGWVVY